MNICLYHGIDLDGFCSGAIYAKAMTEKGKDFELIPANYGWDLPWEKFDGADVTLIDFSMQPWSEFDKLLQIAKEVTWIDHHKSAIDEWKKFHPTDGWCDVNPVLDVKLAGCELAWGHYFGNKHMPLAVRLLGRYDVWDHSDERTMPFQYGMRLYDMDPAEFWMEWVDYLDEHISPEVCEERIREGETVLRYQTREDKIGAKAGCFTVEWEGLTWVAANRGGRGSQFFDSVYDPIQHDGMLGFSWNGEVWTFGMYSTKVEIDCGAIAKRHGGGGHPGAAGFRTTELPFSLESTQKLSKTRLP